MKTRNQQHSPEDNGLEHDDDLAEDGEGAIDARTETTVVETDEREVNIPVIQRRSQVINVLGTRPLYMNTMAEKAWQQLLSPSGRKNMAERQQSQKHDPVEEFRASAFTYESDDSETLLGFPSDAIKRMLEDTCALVPRTSAERVRAAVEVQDANVPYDANDAVRHRAFSRDDMLVPVYGTPFLMMDIVRVRGVPDVRARAFLPSWAMKIRVVYTKGIVDLNEVVRLFAFGGIHVSLGDWRTQKGGQYGKCIIVPQDDAEYQQILLESRKEQAEALRNPSCYDSHTSRLLEWFGKDVEAKKARRKADAEAKALKPKDAPPRRGPGRPRKNA